MENTKSRPSLVILGGGIVGLAIARAAIKVNNFSKVTLVEKEKSLGIHATSRNSGVIHAGFYYSPDSLKGQFCAEGNLLMRDYCMNNSI